jgi:hypothetical protein
MKITVAIIVLLLTGCVSQPAGTMDKAEYLYKNKCGGCHKIYKKDDFSNEKWSKIIASMKIKARLTETEEHIIKDYLTR